MKHCKSFIKNAGFVRTFERTFHRSSIDRNNISDTIIQVVRRTKKQACLISNQRRVVVTGSGMICPLGCQSKEVFDRAMKSQSGIRSLKQAYDYDKVGIHYAAQISKADKDACEAACKGEERLKSLAMKYAEFSTINALQEANILPLDDVDKMRTGISIGNSMADLDFIDSSYQNLHEGKPRKVSPFFVPRILGNMGAAVIAIRYGLKGPNHSVSTACSTGLHSIGDAYHFIKNNAADVMIAGGADAGISPLSIVGFSRARALSTNFKSNPSEASRPFDVDRDGFVMSEGAGVLVLEDLEHALKRNADILCEIVGYGASCDADHITAGLADGSGALMAMIGALINVQSIQGMKDEIWQINAHATSTPRGDAAEMNAVRLLLALIKREHLDFFNSESGPFVTAHKGNLGHMMSAAGSVESALACQSLKSGIIPPILNLVKPEDGIDKDLRLVREPVICGPSKEDCRRIVIKNSFGFGGTNASIVFAEYKA